MTAVYLSPRYVNIDITDGNATYDAGPVNKKSPVIYLLILFKSSHLPLLNSWNLLEPLTNQLLLRAS